MRKKTFFKSLFVFIFILLMIFSSFKFVNASIIWEYEEDLIAFKSGNCYVGYEGYNRVLVLSADINIISFYSWNNPSNDTNIIKIKLGIYSNFANKPDMLLSQTNTISINKIGWINVEIFPIINTVGFDFLWIGWIISNYSGINWQYYKNVTSSFTYYQSNRTWNNLFNPATVESQIKNTRFFAFRLGFYSAINTTSELIFSKNFLLGITIITMIMITFLINRKIKMKKRGITNE